MKPRSSPAPNWSSTAATPRCSSFTASSPPSSPDRWTDCADGGYPRRSRLSDRGGEALMVRLSARVGLVLAALLLWSVLPSGLANAAVKPGDLVTPENASAVSELVSPGNFILVKQGMRMKIVATK